jgi:hypothetical protein
VLFRSTGNLPQKYKMLWLHRETTTAKSSGNRVNELLI